MQELCRPGSSTSRLLIPHKIMLEFTLIIGNKNYSSWSLRPWMLLRHLQLPFDEQLIPLFHPQMRARISQHSPAGRVPVLKHAGLTVWESIAIGEYLCE